MRKQTKLVAVLSAAALLALGASMTSFAAGWEKDEAGIWHFYDEDDEMVTGEWKKDGTKWFYLDDDGNMLTNDWVDDDYFVGEDGAMLVNQWIKTTTDEIENPDEDGEYWYHFNSKGKKDTGWTKIAGKRYFFEDDGKMADGWKETDEGIYYLGGEDEGWRTSGWLWLEAPDEEGIHSLDDEDCHCDEEGWYYFLSDGTMYKDAAKKKKINGKWYYFNDHGQMLYEWINTKDTNKADGVATADTATASDMVYANQVEEGWRADGWYEIAGSKDIKTNNDTNWYYFDGGEAMKAEGKDAVKGTDEKTYYRTKEKINGKWFCFDEKGKMQTGLQQIGANKWYYFDEDGYMKTGKVTVEDANDDTYTFYFNTKNKDNGQGVNGPKDGYLYQNGQRLEAEDDYAVYEYKTAKYVVNTKGKIQKSTTKAYELDGGEGYAKVSSDGTVKVYSDKECKTETSSYTVNKGGFAWEG